MLKSKIAILPVMICALVLSIACQAVTPPAATLPPATLPAATDLPVAPAPTGTEAPVTTQQPAFGKLTCVPAGIYTKCTDDTLRIEFEYPTSWGVIAAVSGSGLSSIGYSYDYTFGGKTFSDSWPLVAGGRSKDYSAGRGPIVTDFSGYQGADLLAQESCDSSQHKFFAICQEIAPHITQTIDLPDAGFICDNAAGPRFSVTPVFTIEINLPDNPTINGFVFQAPFVSEQFSNQMKSELYPLIGFGADMVPTKCDAASQQAFDTQRSIYIQEFTNKTIEPETQKNLDVLMHLATSITFK